MFSKKIEAVSRQVSDLKGTIPASSYIGKKVYSQKGDFVGRIYDVVLKKDSMIGVLVKGDRRVLIGREFFGQESEEGIVLKIEPVTSLLGKQVYDSTGKRIGKVKALNRKTGANVYTDILVKTSIFRRAVPISKNDIEVAKKTIILKKPYDSKDKTK